MNCVPFKATTATTMKNVSWHLKKTLKLMNIYEMCYGTLENDISTVTFSIIVNKTLMAENCYADCHLC